MPTALTETQSYQDLVTDLKELILSGQKSAVSAVNEIKVTTYWKMGQRMTRLRELADPAQSSQLTTQLAEDLQLDQTVLYRILQFHRFWPKRIPRVEGYGQLSWAHYVELLSVKDPKQRDFYLKTSAQEEWSRDTLRKAIQKDYYHLHKIPKLPPGRKTLERGTDPLNIYKAVVEKVVDGDTLLVRIDLGFEVWINQRLRLRGINTAEQVKHGVKTKKTPDRADQAKAFVEDKLKGIPFIVIKTYKTDMYGRYVADVFYHPTLKEKEKIYTKGFFLNAQLLSEDLADPV